MVNVLNVGIPIPYLDHLQVGEAFIGWLKYHQIHADLWTMFIPGQVLIGMG